MTKCFIVIGISLPLILNHLTRDANNNETFSEADRGAGDISKTFSRGKL